MTDRAFARRYQRRNFVALIAGLAGPLLVSLALLPLRSSLTNTNVALILVVVIVAVAANGNRIAGAVAALSSAAAFDFFFTVPYQQFTITERADIETTVLLLIVGLAVSQLAAQVRRLEVLTITDAGYLRRIHDTAELARSAGSPQPVIDQVRRQLADVLSLRECRFEYGKLMGNPPRLQRDGSIDWGLRGWDADRLGLPDADVELRTFRGGSYYGRFMLRGTPGVVPTRQARLVAVTLADQVGTPN